MRLTQKNFDGFLEALNHRMTRIEESVGLIKNDMVWIRRIGYYLCGALSLGIGKYMIGI